MDNFAWKGQAADLPFCLVVRKTTKNLALEISHFESEDKLKYISILTWLSPVNLLHWVFG
jgi:hypothetical protein